MFEEGHKPPLSEGAQPLKQRKNISKAKRSQADRDRIFKEAMELLGEVHYGISRNRIKYEYSGVMSDLEFRESCAGRFKPDGRPYPWQAEWHNAGSWARERLIMAANQVGKCVSPDQEVCLWGGDLKGASEVRVGDYLVSWDVEGQREVGGRVLRVFRKPAEPILRIFLSVGGDRFELETVPGHRWLTVSGWMPVLVSLLDRFGAGDRRLVRALGGLHLSSGEGGFGSGYRVYFGSGGVRPHVCVGTGRVSFPFGAGVVGRILVSLRWDDLVCRCRDILCRFSDRLSNFCEGVLFSPLAGLFGYRVPCIFSGRYPRYSRVSDRFSFGSFPGQPLGSQVFPWPEGFSSQSTPFSVDGAASIIGYEWIDGQELYDFEVDVHHNYLTPGGLVNHNTRSCGAEVSIHATGIYPDWWEGYRFRKPVKICIGSQTNETLRDPQQLELYGNFLPESKLPSGEGWIPKDCIVDVTYRQCGISGVFDEVKVRHVSGGTSVIKHKTYEQGWTKWQGTQYDLYWLDEEPENDDKIYSEVLRGVLKRGGLIIMSRTPLFGATGIIRHFIEGKPGTYYKNVTFDEAPHMTPEQKEQFLAGVPEHERETRSKGVPMMGEGAVYPCPDGQVSCEAFAIPDYYKRIVGLDFGVDHPTAACWLAYDPDSDVIYVTDCYRQRRETIAVHAQAINSRGDWIPVSWPHDGMNKDRSGSGQSLCDLYRKCYVNMLHISARYDDASSGSQAREPVVQECYERMLTGRLKVFSHLESWFEEKRMYHRKDGKIVGVQDDLLSAMHYGVMMLRYAKSWYVQPYQAIAETSDPMQAFTYS